MVEVVVFEVEIEGGYAVVVGIIGYVVNGASAGVVMLSDMTKAIMIKQAFLS